MKTNKAMELLIEAYSGRADDTDWPSVIIDPVDKGLTSVDPTNCLYWGSWLQGLMHDKFILAKPHLIKPLCAVFKNLLDTTPTEFQKDLAKPFVISGIRLVGILSRNGDELGCHEDAIELFKLVQAQVEQYPPDAHEYNVKDMTSFVVNNFERLETKDLLPFLAYGAMYTHAHHTESTSRNLQHFLFARKIHAVELPTLPMNQALVSLFNGTFKQDCVFIDDLDYEPDRSFAQDLLKLSCLLSTIEYEGGHIPRCQFSDLLLVSQTLTAMSKAYTLADDPIALEAYERGAAALVDLTLKPATQKLAAFESPFATTGHSKDWLSPNQAEQVLHLMIQEAQDRPITRSSAIEAAMLRFNRQVYLELAFRGPTAAHFGTEIGKGQLLALADLARDGLQAKEDFSILRKEQKLWITKYSGDEKTKMALLKTHPGLRKDSFVHDLGM
jgi:hypothetical protein